MVDTLKLSRSLTEAGAAPRLAEEIAEAIAQTQRDERSELATKTDLQLLEQRMTIKLGSIAAGAVAVVAVLVRLL